MSAQANQYVNEKVPPLTANESVVVQTFRPWSSIASMVSRINPEYLDEPEYCEGFHFRYFVADKLGRRRETGTNAHFIEAEEKLLKKVSTFLQGRPDLLEGLACLEEGIEIRLYHGKGFSDYNKQVYFYGRATAEGDRYILELASDEIISGGFKGEHGDHEVLDVVIHEFTHILDFLDDDTKEGYLPGWDKQQIVQFDRLREIEKERIDDGESPLDIYALRDDGEFLAVLVETFFLKPKTLRESSPLLYKMLSEFFNVNPANDPIQF